jgi:hypothetical protein
MNPRALNQSVENLRKSRVRPEREVSIAKAVASVADETRRAAKGLGNAGAAWGEVCPTNLVERTRVESLFRNVLTVTVEDTSTKYVLDRWLRDGGEAQVIRACSAAVRKVKLVVGPGGDVVVRTRKS